MRRVLFIAVALLALYSFGAVALAFAGRTYTSASAEPSSGPQRTPDVTRSVAATTTVVVTRTVAITRTIAPSPEPTDTAVPTNTATTIPTEVPSATRTRTRTPTATASPTTTATPSITPSATVTQTRAAQPTVAAAAVVRTSTRTATASPTPSPTPSPTSTPIARVLAAVATPPTPEAVETVAVRTESSARPEMIRLVPSPSEISLDGAVVATNMSFAGLTILIVLFAAQLFNQTISENRDRVEALAARAAAPVRPVWNGITAPVRSVSVGSRLLNVAAGPALLLGLTAVIYGLAEPNFGFNERSLIVAASVLVCVSATTYLSEGGEAFLARLRYGQTTGVRALPVAVCIAACSVALARLADLQPAVIYGFVGTAVFLRPSTLTVEQAGKTAFLPSLALLAVSLLAWALVIPARHFAKDSEAIAPIFIESIAVTIFIVGVQSTFFNMLPLAFLDGQKIWRWNKPIWLAMMVVSTALFWHVFLNRDGAYGGALGTASVAAFAVLFGGLAISIGAWAVFAIGGRRQTLA